MKRYLATAGVITTLALTTAACGSSSGSSSSTASSSKSMSMPSSSSSPMSSSSMSSPMSSASGAMASGPVGPGCAAYAAAVPTGAGSVSGMATAPVATAASNNPMLKTLTAAVSGQLNPKVNLVDTLNGSQFTVFAPVDSAFAKVPASTIDTLKTNSDMLTKILTYHVVAGQLDPSKVIGTQKTVEGGTVTVAGTPDNLTVNGAHVICGGVKTANATVYLIDGVLTPTS